MKKNELSKVLTLQQQRLVMEVSLSEHSNLSDDEEMELLNLPQGIMQKQLLTCIKTRRSLADEVLVKIFQRHKEVGKGILKACIEYLYDLPAVAQMEIFNLPEELRDEMLLVFVKGNRDSRRFCDEAVVKILDLPEKVMMKIVLTYLDSGKILQKEAELKIMQFEQGVAEKIFSVYHHLPEDCVFEAVLERWDDAAKKKFFLANIKKIGGFEFKHYYDRVERIVDLILRFSTADRDELLQAFFDRGQISSGILEKVSAIEDPFRARLLKTKVYTVNAINVLLKLPEPML